jgi:hypothetical protein
VFQNQAGAGKDVELNKILEVEELKTEVQAVDHVRRYVL